jgi:hypothetical protein
LFASQAAPFAGWFGTAAALEIALSRTVWIRAISRHVTAAGFADVHARRDRDCFQACDPPVARIRSH